MNSVTLGPAWKSIWISLFFLVSFASAFGQNEASRILNDPKVNWKNPQERAQLVQRLKAAEMRELQKAQQIAKQRGKPLREELPGKGLRELVGLDEDGELLYVQTRNANASISTGADQLHSSPYSVDGSGLTVGVWDGDSALVTHQEFNEGATSRVNNVNAQPTHNHATHVTGTIAAFGVQANAKGMAPGVTVDSYDWTSDDSEMAAAGADDVNQFDTRLYLSNHSYGFNYGWLSNSGWEWIGNGTDQNASDWDYGKYSQVSRNMDTISYNSPYYLFFWAAGNENTDGPNNGNTVIIGGASVVYDSAIHPPKDGQYRNGFETVADETTAKNMVVVGASNDAVTNGLRDPSKATKVNFSSTGPCDDGRIKPDLMGNGAGLTSTSNSGVTSYTSMSGTSMASPNVCGSAALVVAKYRELFSGGVMRASTLKGLLIHTATDIANPGPDYTTGWGLVDVKSAVDFLIDRSNFPSTLSLQEDQLSNATSTKTYNFTWDGSSAIRATLCWTDPIGAAQTAHDVRTPALVNDLNLKLIAPDGTEYFPFVMPFVGTWTVASMSQNASTGVNFTDNVEQVLIANPGQAGQWQVVISHAGNLTNNLQDYGLLVSGSFDPAGTLSFSSDSYSVNEGAGTVTVTVERIGGAEGAVSVNYATSNGTATAGSDYTAASGTLSWNNNNSVAKTFTIPITSDSTHEDPTETITITLSNPSGIGISGTNPVTLTINDDDNQLPTVDAGAAQTVYLSGSEWSPSSLSPALWLDASDSATITLNGGTVSQWNDKSGNNRHATQATAGSQPTLTSGALNSRNVLTFDGSSDFLNVDLDFMAGVDHSVFVVTKPTTYNNIYGAANSGSGFNSLHVGFRTSTSYRMNYWGNDWGPAVTAKFQAGTANLFNSVWLSGATKEIFANGQSEGINSSAGVVGTMSGGGRISNVTGHGYYGGDIAEFIAFGKSLTSTERQELEGFLAHKWGTTSLLPADHPYKTVGPNSASATATLGGTASDGDSDPLTITWSLFSGPAGVAFDNPNVIGTNVTFSATGTYTLRLTVDDGYGTTVSDDVVITVEEQGAGPNISVSAISGDTGENGAQATFTVVLTTQPTADVSIGLSSSDLGEGTVSPTSLTFTNGNWDTAQTVTVTGADDALLDGAQSYSIVTAAASSADADYNGLNPNDVSVTNLDDDYTLTVVTGSGGNSTTGGGVVDPDDGPHAITATAAAGYQFLNWSVTSGSATFANANSASTTMTATADVTVQANFEPDTYSVTYSGNGNSGGTAPGDQTKTHGVDLTLASNSGSLVKDGYTFDGWNTASDGSGTDYAEEDTYSGNASITLYANWNSPPTVDAGSNQTVYLGGSPALWSPTEASISFWLDASDTNSITLNGSTVQVWEDKSGNTRHVSQTTPSLQPSYAASGVTFNGSSQYLWNNSPFMSGQSGVDIYIMASIPDGQNDRRILSEGSSTILNPIYSLAQTKNDTNGAMGSFIRNDAGTHGLNHVPLSAAGAFNGSTRIYHWRDTGTVASGRFNGGTETTQSYMRNGILTTDRFSVGALLRNVPASYLAGTVYEVVVTSTSSDEQERLNMEGYLAHKWGVQANLPLAHPYKSEAPLVTSTASANLGDASATDADGDPMTYAWTLFNGPAAVTFGDASVLNTTATFTAAGVYTLRLTVNDGRGQTTDDIIITVATPGLDLVMETPSISENGGTSNATLTRLSTVGDLVATLSSDDTSEATVPPSVTIPDGQTTANFTITAINDAIADGTKLVTITAASSGNPDAISTIEITDDEVSTLTLNVVATSVNESAGPGATTATVTRNSETTDELVVNLSSNDTSEANLPASITIASGQSTSPAFDIDAINDAIVDGSQTVAFTASASGHVSGTDTLEVTDDIPFTLMLDMGTGGSSTLGGGLKDPDGSPYSISATADAGYAFVNWTLTSGAATLGDENAALTTVTASANVTLQANFALITYTVSYHGNGSTGGTIPVDASSPYNSAATVTVLGNTGSLTQSGFTFAGWNTASDGSGTSYAAGNTFTINEDTTLFAVWTPIPPTLSITHIGTQFNLETKDNDATVGWRNTTPVKTLDVDGDNIVGTDGYRTSNRGLNPSYLTATVVAPNTNNFSNIDDPNNPSGADVSTGTLHDSNAGLGVETVPLLQFVMTGAVPLGETLRVGILIDGVTSALGTNSATYTLRQTVGGSAAVTSPVLNWQDGGLDVTYFDLTGLSDGDTFVVTARNSATNTEHSSAFEQVIGITFDTGVITPPGETFTDWISGFSGLGGLTAFGDDPDGDGIKNGIENYFGTHPGASSQGIVAQAANSNTFTFSHPLNEAPASNVTAGYRWSKDLSGFHADGATFESTTVTFVQGTPANGMVTVTATTTGTTVDRLFVDIAVTQN